MKPPSFDSDSPSCQFAHLWMAPLQKRGLRRDFKGPKEDGWQGGGGGGRGGRGGGGGNKRFKADQSFVSPREMDNADFNEYYQAQVHSASWGGRAGWGGGGRAAGTVACRCGGGAGRAVLRCGFVARRRCCWWPWCSAASAGHMSCHARCRLAAAHCVDPMIWRPATALPAVWSNQAGMWWPGLPARSLAVQASRHAPPSLAAWGGAGPRRPPVSARCAAPAIMARRVECRRCVEIACGAPIISTPNISLRWP